MDLRRRDTLMFLVASCATAFAARAQQAGKVYRLAWLSGTPIVGSDVWTEFVAAMRNLGWIEGKNYTVENLRYEGRSERLPALAAEAVERNFDPWLPTQNSDRTIHRAWPPAPFRVIFFRSQAATALRRNARRYACVSSNHSSLYSD